MKGVGQRISSAAAKPDYQWEFNVLQGHEVNAFCLPGGRVAFWEGIMAIVKKLKDLFDDAKVSYEVYNHPLAYTAQEIAQRQHFSGDQMAKVVILKADEKLVMAIVTGSQKIHLPTVRTSLGVHEVKLATEDEFISRFPDCEIGAMPPFGNLFGLPVYVDPAVTKDESIYFNSGNHVQTVRIRYKDFERLVTPQVARLTEEKKKRAA